MWRCPTSCRNYVVSWLQVRSGKASAIFIFPLRIKAPGDFPAGGFIFGCMSGVVVASGAKQPALRRLLDCFVALLLA
jgi:hypothetical protein